MAIQSMDLGASRKPARTRPVWPFFLLGAVLSAASARVAGYQAPSQDILSEIRKYTQHVSETYVIGLAVVVALLIWLFLFFGIVRARNAKSGLPLFLFALAPAAGVCWLGSQDYARRVAERAIVETALNAHHQSLDKLTEDFGRDMTRLSLLDVYNRVRTLHAGSGPIEFVQQVPFTARDVPSYRAKVPQGQALVAAYQAKFAAADTALTATIGAMRAPEGEKAQLQAAAAAPDQAQRWTQFWQLQQQQVSQTDGLLDLYAKGQANGAAFSAIQATIYGEQKTTSTLFDKIVDESNKLEARVREAEPR